MMDRHLVATLALTNKTLPKQERLDDVELGKEVLYKQAIGFLIYANVIKRPIISFAMNDVAR